MAVRRTSSPSEIPVSPPLPSRQHIHEDRGHWCEVLYDFVAEFPGELSMKVSILRSSTLLTSRCTPHLSLHSSPLAALLTSRCTPHLSLHSSPLAALLTSRCTPHSSLYFLSLPILHELIMFLFPTVHHVFLHCCLQRNWKIKLLSKETDRDRWWLGEYQGRVCRPTSTCGRVQIVTLFSFYFTDRTLSI